MKLYIALAVLQAFASGSDAKLSRVARRQQKGRYLRSNEKAGQIASYETSDAHKYEQVRALGKGGKATYIIVSETADGNTSSDAQCTQWDISYVTETKPQYYYWQPYSSSELSETPQYTTTETQYYYYGKAGKGRKLGKSDKQIVMKEVEVTKEVKTCVSWGSNLFTSQGKSGKAGGKAGKSEYVLVEVDSSNLEEEEPESTVSVIETPSPSEALETNPIPTSPPVGGLPTLPPQIGGLPTLPPGSSAPPLVGGLPTLPPQIGGLPTLPPGSSSPPQIGGLPTLPPGGSSPPQTGSGSLPTLPPASVGLQAGQTLPPGISNPPQSGALPTLPPGASGTTSPPQSFADSLPTLPPGGSSPPIVGLPTLLPGISSPPQSGIVPTLPPGMTLPPQSGIVPTLPPGSTPPPQSGIVGLPTLPPGSTPPPQSGIGSLPTLPPGISSPPQSGIVPTLPPGSTFPPQSGIVGLPTLPPGVSSPPQSDIGSLLSLPPGLTPPPQSGFGRLPTLPPGSSAPPQSGFSAIPTLPPGAAFASIPTLPPESSLPQATVGLPTLPPLPVGNDQITEDLNVLTWDFEDGAFPVAPWTTAGDGEWAIDQSQVDGGIYSIKSPDLESIYTGTGLTSNATLTLDDSFSGGVLKMRAYASVQPPRDFFQVYVDGVNVAQLVSEGEFTDMMFGVSPGSHTIDFSYQYDPFGIPEFGESSPERLGATWIDNVSIETAAQTRSGDLTFSSDPESPSVSSFVNAMDSFTAGSGNKKQKYRIFAHN